MYVVCKNGRHKKPGLLHVTNRDCYIRNPDFYITNRLFTKIYKFVTNPVCYITNLDFYITSPDFTKIYTFVTNPVCYITNLDFDQNINL